MLIKNVKILFFILLTNFTFGKITIQHSINHMNPDLYEPIVSPNGKYMATIGNNKVKIWDTQGNLLSTFLDDDPYINPPNKFKYWQPQRRIYTVTFLPNNKELAVSAFKRRIYILGLDGEVKKRYILKDLKGATESSGIYKIVFFPKTKRLLTYETPYNDEFVIRDLNFKLIKRINMKNSTYSQTFHILSHPSSKYFIVGRSPAIPSKNGWDASIQLFNLNGKVIKDIENNKPEKIKTPDGKMKKKFIHPKQFQISPNGKTLIYLERNSFKDPLKRKFLKQGRTKKVEVNRYWYGRIRWVNLFNNKKFEFWISEEANDIRHISFLNNQTILAIGTNHIYHFSLKGKLLKTIKNKEITYKGKKIPFSISNAVIVPKQKIISAYEKKYLQWIIYKTNGKIIRFLPKPSFKFTNVAISHRGDFLTFEVDRANKSLVFDTKKNKVFTKNASVWYDNKNREYSLSHSRKAYENIIKYHQRMIKISHRNEKYVNLLPLPNGTYANLKNKFTLFKLSGVAIRRYPKAKISLDTAIEPKLKYYVYANTSDKYKTFQLFNMNGKKIKEFYVGAFFSFGIKTSLDGKWIIAGHDNAGVISIWNKNGKLLNRIFNLHSTSIKGVALTENKRFLLSTAIDGTIKILDLKTKNVLSLSLLKNNQFLASDLKGRFNCSKEAKNFVSIVQSNKNQNKKLWNKAFTPKLIYKFLKGK